MLGRARDTGELRPTAAAALRHTGAMDIGLRARVLPENQRRTSRRATSDLDLNEGDLRSKRSAYWTMLFLASCIACAGIIADSTATVIGAMIIAPLSTPIMGTALALVKRERTGGVKFVVLGALLVIAVGLLFSLIVPSTTVLLGQQPDRQPHEPAAWSTCSPPSRPGSPAPSRSPAVTSRPSCPASPSRSRSCRRWASSASVSGRVAVGLAFGALVLFLSNFLALVFAGSLVFTSLGYTRRPTSGPAAATVDEGHLRRARPARRSSR